MAGFTKRLQFGYVVLVACSLSFISSLIVLMKGNHFILVILTMLTGSTVVVSILFNYFLEIRYEINQRISRIQKGYNAGFGAHANQHGRLDPLQLRLLNYVMADYSIDELLRIFSFGLRRMSTELRKLELLLKEEAVETSFTI